MEVRTPRLDELINSYLMCCATEGKSRKTVDWYSTNLRRFYTYLNDNKLPVEAAAVFEALRALRLELAREDSVPAFVVASDRTLRDIAFLRPRNRSELLRAHGIGEAKADRYGRQILEAVERSRPD
jgi:ATP-dependent DNA helicase RecQ